MAKVFFSYSHADEALRDRLEKHLSVLKRNGAIETWHDRRIIPGTGIDPEIDTNLNDADIVLLLVSSDFLASDYCYTREMQRAMERHQAKNARVIPVILRPCDWKSAPFGGCLALPKDGRPVVDWPNEDAAFLSVVDGVRAALPAEQSVSSKPAARGDPVIAAAVPRSSNLRVRRTFSDADRYRFAKDGFEFILKFFAGSVAELNRRHRELDGTVTSLDPTYFHAVIFSNGRSVSECHIRLRAQPRGGRSEITFAWGEDRGGSSYNESLSIDADDQSLHFQPQGMQHRGQPQDEGRLSFEGAAELYWGLFIEPLQR